MKELKLLKTEKELHQKKKQKQEIKLIGSTLMKPGLKLFEFDWEKMEIKEADIKKTSLVRFSDKMPAEKSKVYHNKKAYYFQALNLKYDTRKI